MKLNSKLVTLVTTFIFLAAGTGLYAQEVDQAVESLTRDLLESLPTEETTIAVVEFTDLAGEVTPLGRLIAEELTSELFTAGNGRLKIVERTKLEQVLGEQRLGVKGLLEKQNIETFGRVLGVDAILTGSTAVIGDRIRVNARLVAVPSAELFSTAASYMSKTGLPDQYLQAEEPLQGKDSSEKAPSTPVATKQMKGIAYELLGCHQETRLILCRLVLTNNAADREYWMALSWNSRTFFFDQRGHRFEVTRIRIADVDETGGGAAKKYLITEIPTEAILYFEGVPSSIEFIKILHIATSDGDIEFRDVHFSANGG